MAEETDKARRAREATDMRRLIRAALDSPIHEGKQYELDGKRELDFYKKKNTDVKTRMILSIAVDAMKGDRQAAEFLMKYGGFEPPKEQNVTVELPTFVDDISARALLSGEGPEEGEEEGN